MPYLDCQQNIIVCKKKKKLKLNPKHFHWFLSILKGRLHLYSPSVTGTSSSSQETTLKYFLERNNLSLDVPFKVLDLEYPECCPKSVPPSSKPSISVRTWTVLMRSYRLNSDRLGSGAPALIRSVFSHSACSGPPLRN